MQNIPDTFFSGRTVATAVALLLSTGAFAHEGHVHQHGLASLEITQQDNTVVASFRSPLDSLIGFETRPANDEQRALAGKLLDQLKDSGAILNLPAAAGCVQQSLDIDAPTLKPDDHDHDDDRHGDADDDHDHEDGDHDGHAHKHGDHDHGKAGHQHAHGKSAHKHGDDEKDEHASAGKTAKAATGKHAHKHEADEDHDHDEDGDHDHDADHDGHDHDGHQHADLSVSYTFKCQKPAAIDRVTLPVFKHWPRLHAVDAAVVNDNGQRAERLTPSSTSIAW